MAREYAKVKAGIWQDDDFRALPPHAQHLYFVILTDPKLSYCGVTDWRPKRLLPRSAGWEMQALEEAAAILVDRRLLIIDEDTEEVLVKSFLRHDGVMAHNKLCVSAMLAYGEVASNTIRGIIVHELNRLAEEFPAWPTWEREQVKEVLKRQPLDPWSEQLGNPLGHALDPNLANQLAPRLAPNASSGLGVPYNNNSNSNITTTTYGCDTAAPKRTRKAPATPIPDGWAPTEAHAAKAKELGVDLHTEKEKFIAHAQANDRRQVKWDAAFNQWLIKSAEYKQTRPTQGGFSSARNPAHDAIDLAKELFERETRLEIES